MEKIETEYYSIEIEPAQKFLTIKVNGFWSERKTDRFDDYLENVMRAANYFSGQPFAVISDITELKTPPKSVFDMFVETQKLLSKKGMVAIAQVQAGDVIMNMSANRMARESHVYQEVFHSILDARNWAIEYVNKF